LNEQRETAEATQRADNIALATMQKHRATKIMKGFPEESVKGLLFCPLLTAPSNSKFPLIDVEGNQITV